MASAASRAAVVAAEAAALSAAGKAGAAGTPFGPESFSSRSWLIVAIWSAIACMRPCGCAEEKARVNNWGCENTMRKVNDKQSAQWTEERWQHACGRRVPRASRWGLAGAAARRWGQQCCCCGLRGGGKVAACAGGSCSGGRASGARVAGVHVRLQPWSWRPRRSARRRSSRCARGAARSAASSVRRAAPAPWSCAAAWASLHTRAPQPWLHASGLRRRSFLANLQKHCVPSFLFSTPHHIKH